jgi:hypothetical protein
MVNATSRPLYPRETSYPLYRWLCGPQERSGRVRKISPPPGFDPRTVQPQQVAIPTKLSRPTKATDSIITYTVGPVSLPTLQQLFQHEIPHFRRDSLCLQPDPAHFSILIVLTYTGCFMRNGPYFERTFLRLIYNNITKNTYIRRTVTAIVTRE